VTDIMDRLDVVEEMRAIVVFHLAAEETHITPDARFIEDLGADSLDVHEIIMSCEEKFNVNIPDYAAAKVVTVGDAVALIKAQLG
jgi:acyl carrier protein